MKFRFESLLKSIRINAICNLVDYPKLKRYFYLFENVNCFLFILMFKLFYNNNFCQCTKEVFWFDGSTRSSYRFFSTTKICKKGLEYFSPPPTTSKSNINAWTPHLFFFCLHHTIRLFASSYNQYHSATISYQPQALAPTCCSINPPQLKS